VRRFLEATSEQVGWLGTKYTSQVGVSGERFRKSFGVEKDKIGGSGGQQLRLKVIARRSGKNPNLSVRNWERRKAGPPSRRKLANREQKNGGK